MYYFKIVTGVDIMAKGLIDLLADTISDLYWTDERIGRHGEKLTERKLNLINLFGRKGKTLKNIYIPKDNGETSEIDLVYITQKGIFVIESKNYSGWIFGDAYSQYWTSSLPNGEKNRFYSPLKQNRTHIKWLASYMANYSSISIPMFSIIVFSDRCELKKVPADSPEAIICKRESLYWRIRKIWGVLPDILSDTDIEVTYNILSNLTDVTEAQKQTHIDNINKNINKGHSYSQQQANLSQPNNDNLPITPQGTVPCCPKCGSPLVLRTAKKGNNAGNQFYGCSNFPKCRYIQNL